MTQHEKFRHKLPNDRTGVTHKFDVAGHEGYLTVNCYADGRPGEMFLTMSKHGAFVSGIIDCFAVAVSVALQYNVPLDVLVRLFKHRRFEPSGITSNPAIPEAKSIVDYIFRWMEHQYLTVPVDSDDPGGALLAPGASSEITEAADPTK